MRRIQITTLSLITAAMCAAAAPEPARDADTIVVTLEQVKETRRLDVVESDSGFGMFDMPGLELRFALDVPAGRKVVEVRQPSALEAADSKGTDLSKLPRTDFGVADHVDVIREWEKPPHALTFKLGLPARASTSFSLRASMEAVTYEKTEQITIPAKREWTPIPAGQLGDEDVKVRLEANGGSVNLVFMPGTVRDMIDGVELVGSGVALEHQGTMWNDTRFAHMFMGSLDATADVTAQITVRRGLAMLPLEIDLRDQRLP